MNEKGDAISVLNTPHPRSIGTVIDLHELLD